LGAPQVDVQGELDRLRAELDELRASRRRLVVAADADRRAIERELHDGVHQHLIALAVSLQLAGQAEGSDPAALRTLLAEMGGAVQDALEETARLAHRIHPATLEAGDLATLLRSAALAAGVQATVAVTATGSYAPEAVMTIHLCWLNTVARAGRGSAASIEVRDEPDTLAFEITGTGIGSPVDLGPLRERVEALGGHLAVTSSRGGDAVVACSLPAGR
jgi:signal transduction histidine kinase